MKWRDRSAENPHAMILSNEPRPCFFCGRETFAVDLDYQAPYCGDDNEAIAADLERLAATTRPCGVVGRRAATTRQENTR